MTYEIVAILSPKLPDDQVEAEQGALRQLIEQGGGKVLREDAWGKRELAYEIQGLSHGIYIQMDFDAEPSVIKELDNQLKLRDAFIRVLVVKKEKGLGTLSDFGAQTASSEGEESESEAPKTVEEATATPDVLAASTKAEEKDTVIDTSVEAGVEKVAPEASAKGDDTSKEVPKEESVKEEKKEEKKKTGAGMEDLDKKLDDILDSSLDEEIK